MATFRTAETEARYQVAIAAGLTRPLKDVPSLMDWKYWRLIRNEYPHDQLHTTHDMLIPIRVFPLLTDMNLFEATEFLSILSELSTRYQTAKLNFPSQQTVLDHFHLHLVINKDVFKQWC